MNTYFSNIANTAEVNDYINIFTKLQRNFMNCTRYHKINDNQIMSFPIYHNKKFYIFFSDEIGYHDVSIKYIKYKDAGIKIDDKIYPCIPKSSIDLTTTYINKHVIAWINIVISNMFKTSILDIINQHIFLIYVYYVNNSICNEDIKNNYHRIGKVVAGDIINKHSGYIGRTLMTYIKKIKKTYIMFNTINIFETYTYLARECFENINHCNSWNNRSKIKHCYPTVYYHKINQIINKEYTCAITCEDTSKTGGYMIAKHGFGNKKCSPRYVFSQSAYDNHFAKVSKYGLFKCIFCKESLLLSSSFIKVDKQTDNINNRVYLPNNSKNNNNKKYGEIIKLSEYDFETLDYDFLNKKIILTTNIKDNGMVIFSEKQFKKKAYSLYNFVKHLSYKNYAICGGFVRSILLGQCINDIDIFMFGDEHNNVADIFNRTVNDIVYNIIVHNNVIHHDDINFMFLYKENTKVFEILVLNDDELYCKIQIILRWYKNIHEILDSFDIGPSKVAFDGRHVYFTQESALSFKYMMNYIAVPNSGLKMCLRIIKYLYFGFNIVVDNITDKNYNNISFGSIKFTYDTFDNNIYYVSTCDVEDVKDAKDVDDTDNIENMEDDNNNANKLCYDDIVELCVAYEKSILCSQIQFKNNFIIMKRTMEYIDKINNKKITIFVKKMSGNDFKRDILFDNMKYDNHGDYKKIIISN